MERIEFTVEKKAEPTPSERIAEILENPGFGHYFTDHMVTIEWSVEKGWHDARVRPYEPFVMDPASMVFHYGQAIFEGIKAYRQPDGSITTFRPQANAARFRSSAERLAMPELPEELFVGSLEQLLAVDHEWVPKAGGEESLYIRPFMIAREISLGVHPADSYTYAVIASPAGAYFNAEIKPVSVWISEDYVRAAPKGTGAAKFAGNYAASLLAQAQAEEKGCNQVVWLDATELTYIEEMGGMNLMFVYGGGDDVSIITPRLSGSLLAGITRDSLLQVARDLGYKTDERRISKQEWREDATSGAISEAFACGTAAVITPVGLVKTAHGDFTVNNGESGEVTMQLRRHLTGIQRGEVEDIHGWMYELVSAEDAQK